ncbi:MAG: hypothetical protein OEQ14_13820 [Gammaproteobacteria bacterium]|nr:hypothetical protein [Gammaproteobacteria bacterium]
MRPDGDALQRKASMWSEDSDDKGEPYFIEFAEEELEAVAGIYGAKVPSELAARHEFEGRFSGELPGEFGSSGWYVHGETSMGSLFAYFERFGDDRIAIDLRSREVATHRTVDLLIAWLESEFGEDPDFPKFRDFMDTVVREDLWNIVLYSWGYDLFGYAMEPQPSKRAEDRILMDLAIRNFGYLAEHDYFDPLQIPQYVSASGESGGDQAVLTLIARSLAAKAGVPADEPLPAPLAAMADDFDELMYSLDEFSRESDTVRQMLEEWNSSGDNPVELEDSGDSVLEQLITAAVMPEFDLFGTGGDSLRVTLHVPVEPIASNGQWDAQGTLRWSRVIKGRADVGENLPDMLYATWSEPATSFQLEHFGQVVLQHDNLADYWFWRTELSSAHADEWDAFVTTLTPGPGLRTTLLQYCMTGDEEQCAKAREMDDSYYDIVDAIIRRLDSEPDRPEKRHRTSGMIG